MCHIQVYQFVDQQVPAPILSTFGPSMKMNPFGLQTCTTPTELYPDLHVISTTIIAISLG